MLMLEIITREHKMSYIFKNFGRKKILNPDDTKGIQKREVNLATRKLILMSFFPIENAKWICP